MTHQSENKGNNSNLYPKDNTNDLRKMSTINEEQTELIIHTPRREVIPTGIRYIDNPEEAKSILKHWHSKR